MRKQAAATAIVLTLSLGMGRAHADLVTVGTFKDNTLYQSSSGSLSNGAGSYVFAGRTNQTDSISRRRGLLAFDIAGNIPAGSIINEVTLTLYMSMTASGPQSVSLHRVLADWGESTSDAPGEEGAGAPAAPGDATWLHRFFPSTLWSTPGGDFVPTPSATTIVEFSGVHYSWSSDGLVADVQAWLDNPAANFGWLVMGNESTGFTAKRFDTRESPFPEYRPALTIDFTIPEPATLAFVVLGGIFAFRRRRR